MLPPAPEVLLPPGLWSRPARNRMSGGNPPLRGHPTHHHVTGAPSPRTEISLGARRPRGNDERPVRSIVPGVIAVA